MAASIPPDPAPLERAGLIPPPGLVPLIRRASWRISSLSILNLRVLSGMPSARDVAVTFQDDFSSAHDEVALEGRERPLEQIRRRLILCIEFRHAARRADPRR